MRIQPCMNYNHVFPSHRRKRSPSSDTNDSLLGEPAQKMVQVNGSVMVPAELTNQHFNHHHHPHMITPPPPLSKAELKVEGIPEISDTNEEYLAFLA